MSTEKVLIVDDDRNLLEVLKMRLESLHYDVTAVLKEGEAKKAMAGEPFDLAIVDLQLAEMDGISLMEEFHLINPEMPVIILTAHGSIESAVKAMKRGAYTYLTKPFDARELGVQIERALENQRFAVKLRESDEHLMLEVAELAADNKELESFSYAVSHDLRAPLRHIAEFSRVLMDEYNDKLDKEGKKHLARIINAGERMHALIDDLLKLSRITRSELRRDRVNLSAMARAIADELADSQPERNTEFIIEDGLHAHGDPSLIRLALENLFGNAWKFTGKRQQARIEFGARQKDGERIFFVQDNGAGFNMEYAGKLFVPFQRMHKDSEFPGTGIGLATVQRVISRHGGRIWAESEMDQGTIFYFTL